MIGLTPIEELTWKVLQIENDLKALRGDANVRAQSHTITSSTTPSTSSGVTLSQVLALIKRAFIYEEAITSTGTSHVTAFNVALTPGGEPLLFLEMNGQIMNEGGTSQRSWTFTAPNVITTVRSKAASDTMIARYIKANP